MKVTAKFQTQHSVTFTCSNADTERLMALLNGLVAAESSLVTQAERINMKVHVSSNTTISYDKWQRDLMSFLQENNVHVEEEEDVRRLAYLSTDITAEVEVELENPLIAERIVSALETEFTDVCLVTNSVFIKEEGIAPSEIESFISHVREILLKMGFTLKEN